LLGLGAMALEKKESDIFLVMALLMFLMGFGLQEPLSLISWFSAGFVASYSFLIRFGIIGDERDGRR
tara:strand:- start:840 stop:1040 length:201 start_codon:yes stop_codon:yes gene_type:complete